MSFWKRWFNRNPYIPAIMLDVEPTVIDPDLAKLTQESTARSEKHALRSRSLSLSVVSLHEDLIKILGQRA